MTPGDRAQRAAKDPLVLRVSLLVAGVILLIPVAMIFRSGDGGRSVETAGLPGAAAILETGGASSTDGVTGLANATATTVLTVPSTVSSTGATPTSAAATTTAPAADTAAALAPIPPPTEAITVAPTAAPTTAGTTAAPRTTAAAPSCNRTYEVSAGDYWLSIARAHDVPLAALLSQNSATAATALFPGQSVCLPANATTPTAARAPAPAPAPAPATTRPPAATAAPPTTAKPTTTAAAAVPPPANNYSRDDVVAIIRAVWPDELEEKAIAVATRESNLNPTVRNYCCFGLFQIYWNVHKSWLKEMGITSAAGLYDPTANTTAAYALYQRSGGWGPWGG